MTQEELHLSLLDPRAFPSPPGDITYRETHVSRLYLTDCRVYKIKKPVNFGFLDFSTLEQRHHFCLQEVLLNRRFTPDTYLGVVPIRIHKNQVYMNGVEGRIVDYAVEMRRLPQERMLDQLVENKDPNLEYEVQRLAISLAGIHSQCPIYNDKTADFTEMIRRNWEENFLQTEPYVGQTIIRTAFDHLRSSIRTSIGNLNDLMRQRQKEGKIRDCHGDLHADHICMTDPICIYDCIEFNDRFRIGDILSDLAFLLMDLDKRGAQNLAKIIAKTWSSLLKDEIDPALLSFYELYRAFVRGKVNCFLIDDPSIETKDRLTALKKAQEYFELALGYLTPQTLLITCGVMGAGKTTLCREVSLATRGVHLRSDLVRKNLFNLAITERSSEEFGEGIYSSSATQSTYDQLYNLAQYELASGRTVIVDAAFSSIKERDRFRQLAKDRNVNFVLLHIYCDESMILERLRRRWDERSDPSDGRPELFSQHTRSMQIPSYEEKPLQVDSSIEHHDNVQMILVQMAKAKM